jgi:hypothetical protein
VIASAAIGSSSLLDMEANGSQHHHPLVFGLSSRNEARTLRQLACLEFMFSRASFSTVCLKGMFGSTCEKEAQESNIINHNQSGDNMQDNNN